jgi:molybdopterin/thiamine biosynthesis adenylyltransferase/rhodanese-related sulfurtransferase/molybdopterin converting factor small subunit
MSARVHIPTPLRAYTDRQGTVQVEARSVAEALQNLTGRYAELRKHLYGEDGRLRNFVNVYVGEEDIRNLQGEETPLPEGAELSIVPSIAGGATTTAAGGATTDAPPAGRTGDALIAAGRAEEVELSNEEILRYSRHLIMPEVGLKGQRKLKAARVLLIGAGGLGSPLGLYLAAAGVGTIGVVDFDVVDETNLQRQLLHGTRDVGRRKLDSARDRLTDVNPHVRVEGHEARLSSENALELFRDYDVIVDGTDNFPTRYLVNDACVLLGKPNVYGSIFRFEGQNSVFWAERGPCYRCLYQEPPPPGLVPSCAEGGVLGVLPGIVGSIQALETIKLVLGAGDPLVGRLLLFDALALRFRELRLRKDPGCPLCGESPTIRGLIDYDEFCGIPQARAQEREDSEVPQITATALKERLDRGDRLTIVDVREPHEWEIGNLARHGSRLIPLGEVPARMNELSTADEIVLHCRTGPRSIKALNLLRQAGFRKLWNLQGGILAWSEEVDPSIPRY